MSVDLIAEFEQHLRRNRRAETTVNRPHDPAQGPR
jgi:hypothetical protein